MKQFKCLSCEGSIQIEQDTMIGELVECDSCGQEHEFVEVNGETGLDFAPEVEEDWGE